MLSQDQKETVGRRIYLASDEWGNEKMQELARLYLAVEPHADFVEVYEHGGWFLYYALSEDGALVCVGSANDEAQYTQSVRSLIRKLNSKPIRFLPEVRR